MVQNHVRAPFTSDKIQKESALRWLVDTVDENIRSLNDLNEPTVNWDTPLICLIAIKLDSIIRKLEHMKGEIKKPLLTGMIGIRTI